MSDRFQEAATCERTSSCDALRAIVRPQEKDPGGFSVRRLMPKVQVRSVEPFIFFDHLGPARVSPGTGIDVCPHPHIGRATVTYLFEREILHRDSLGNVEAIRPVDINGRTATSESPIAVIGGRPLGERIVWWNLVASRKERIDRARQAWTEGRFPAVSVETEFIPLPEKGSA